MEFYRPNTAVLGCVHSPNYLLLQLEFLCCSYTSQLSPGGAFLTLLHTPSPALACALSYCYSYSCWTVCFLMPCIPCLLAGYPVDGSYPSCSARGGWRSAEPDRTRIPTLKVLLPSEEKIINQHVKPVNVM